MEPSDDPHPSSSCSTYAFISHSQESLPMNGQSNSEYATSGARRRRRRTSPQDQAILEEEYRKCDRPDKARRREITKLVHMGEKEVQVRLYDLRCGGGARDTLHCPARTTLSRARP